MAEKDSAKEFSVCVRGVREWRWKGSPHSEAILRADRNGRQDIEIKIISNAEVFGIWDQVGRSCYPPRASGSNMAAAPSREYVSFPRTRIASMTRATASRRHLLLPWTVQEREDPVLEFERGEGVYFFDRQGHRYLDFLSQLFNCNLGHGNRRVIEAIGRQAERACCVTPQFLTPERSDLGTALARRTPGDLNVCYFVNSGSEADDQAFILRGCSPAGRKSSPSTAVTTARRWAAWASAAIRAGRRSSRDRPAPCASSTRTATAAISARSSPPAASTAWTPWRGSCSWRTRRRWRRWSSSR